METPKNQSKLHNDKNTGRRSFIWKLGAVMTTGVVVSSVSTVANSDNPGDSGNGISVEELSEKLAILEAEKSIVKLYQTYETLLNNGIYDKISDLFVSEGEAVYNGGIFRGRDKGVTRLYNSLFRSGFTGKKMDVTLVGIEGSIFELAQDFLSAKASFPFAIQAGKPMVSESVLVSMARLHGGGINKWIEKGICELTMVRKSKEDVWMIERLEYRSESKSVSVPAFTKVFPADPEGPDLLV